MVEGGVPLLPADIAAAIEDGRIGPSPVPAARGGLALAEPIWDGDMVISTDDSEEEDPSKRELVSDHNNDNNANRIFDPTSTPTPAGTLSPVESAADNAADRSTLKNMKQHREEDALRGHAVKNQKAMWDKTLEMRFFLQKAFSTSNKLPQEPIKTRFCNHDTEIEQAYDDLLNSSKQTLGSIRELQEALLESNQAAKEMPSASNGENDEWSEVQRLQTRITTFRNTEVDKWQRKIQVTTGAAALKGKLHAFNQNISDQVACYMRDPSRMINRMYLTKSAVGVFGEDAREPETVEEV
ncbi:uncharacterized protein LOC133930952 [Phragmites australis]|uniref:uncharacterized protein LOC133930952 n=1 Tax=Phragmites australis TaxID=29695 RepID=UPI002D789A8A|nr:uncharacterized protein LOC133930952 [Phragmites australis]